MKSLASGKMMTSLLKKFGKKHGSETTDSCDTNIFIRAFRGNTDVRGMLDKIGNEQIAASVITYSEIIYGTKKADLQRIKTYFDSVQLIHISEQVSKTFIGISLNYSYSHHIKIPDALIAATSIANGLHLYTENKKDFDFIPEIEFYKPKA
jgi:predicted nucleic acid-binding protein